MNYVAVAESMSSYTLSGCQTFLWNFLLYHTAALFQRSIIPPILLDAENCGKALLGLHFFVFDGKFFSCPVLVNMLDAWFALSTDLLCRFNPLLRSFSGEQVDMHKSQTTSSLAEDFHLENLFYNEGVLFSIFNVCFCFKLIWLNIWKAKTSFRLLSFSLLQWTYNFQNISCYNITSFKDMFYNL